MVKYLTDQAIRAAAKVARESRKQVRITDSICHGLRIDIQPTGHSAWVLVCRDNTSAMKNVHLGDYPLMTIAQAREQTPLLRARVRGGDNPTDKRQADIQRAKDARLGIGTLRALLTDYDTSGKAVESYQQSKQCINRVFSKLLDKSITELTHIDLQNAANDYKTAKQADKAVRTLRPVLKWGADLGKCKFELCLLKAKAPPIRQRYLSENELKQILPFLINKTPAPLHRLAMRFMMLTLCRETEATEMPWSEIDLEKGTWTISPKRTKNNSEHILDLPCQAIELLKSLHSDNSKSSDYVFKSQINTPLGNWDRARKQIQIESKTSNWHCHDLRRTGATQLGKMGLLPHIIEAGLNHKSIHNALASVYNVARYRSQVKEALQQLADFYDNLLKSDENEEK